MVPVVALLVLSQVLQPHLCVNRHQSQLCLSPGIQDSLGGSPGTM